MSQFTHENRRLRSRFDRRPERTASDERYPREVRRLEPITHELDRLGRSFADLAGFVEDPREKGVDIDLVSQPIGTVGEDDWVAEMMLNMTMVFADAEREMIGSRVHEGVDAAIADGKRVRPPTIRLHR